MQTLTFDIAITADALRTPWLAVLAARCAPWLRDLTGARAGAAALACAPIRWPAANAASHTTTAYTASLTWNGTLASLSPAAVAQFYAVLQHAVKGVSVVGVPVLQPPQAQPAFAFATGADLCLDLRSPLPMAPHDGCLTAQGLLDLVASRHRQVFGSSPELPDTAASLLVLGHFATRGVATAGPALLTHTQRAGIRGVTWAGQVFIRGASAALVKVLGALQPFHLVDAHKAWPVEWRGSFQMRWQTGPWLDHGLTRLTRLARTAQQAYERADMPPITGENGAVLDPGAVAKRLCAQLKSTGGYQPQPTQAWVLHRPGKAPRVLERLAPADLVVQQHLLRMLAPCVDRLFSPHSFGFRAGMGRDDAVGAVRAALREGFVYVVESDIAQCFASIDHARLNPLLDRVLLLADVKTRALLGAFIAQPYEFEGRLCQRTAGLAQGAPLSPLLANLYLTALDGALDLSRFRFVRFADDFVVLARTRADAAQALAQLTIAVANLGLRLAPEKTSVTHVQQGFVFLGERFTLHSTEPLDAAVAAQRKPLLVTEPYLQIGVNGSTVEARRAGALVGSWPMRRLSGVMLMARATLSTTLLERCSQNGIGIAVALQGGKHIAVLAPNQRSHHQTLHLHASWHEGLSASAKLAAAHAVVTAKLHNYASLVQQREPSSAVHETLQEVQRALTSATTVDTLRGHEGHAARVVFKWLQTQFVATARVAFSSRKRARGAPDRLNSLLNLGYHLLFSKLNAMVRLRALNPYLGWLHDSEDNYETLVYDLMEPFRPFVDRLVLRMVNRQEIGVRHFEKTDSGLWLTPEGARRLNEGFERLLGERVSGHLLRDLLWTQVRSVHTLVAGEGPLWLFRWALRAPVESGVVAEPPMWSASDGFTETDAENNYGPLARQAVSA
jgi:CRISPR-associated endonuclease Cas1